MYDRLIKIRFEYKPVMQKKDGQKCLQRARGGERRAAFSVEYGLQRAMRKCIDGGAP